MSDSTSDTRKFTQLNPSSIGIEFQNQLEYTEEFNAYTYRNFYNGGGVGIGDINNDGLQDLFFCGNLVDNKLYLNKGNWQFEDITEQAGVASKGVWSTGVSFVDINGDGWLDIYVCKSGNPEGERRYNELFINNGDLTFSEQASEYGIDDKGLSTHAAFFDYDKDGDLDFYLLNNSFRSVGAYDFRPGLREIRDTLGGNKLYRNDIINSNGNAGSFFTDVSEEAGIYGSAIGFGLGVTIGDVNKDGWPDIFVSNDFFERDYLYINNKDGSFSEKVTELTGELSLGSMGADMADINNDGFPEIFVTDMLPENDARMKTTTTFDNWDKYQLYLNNGYHKQFTRNVLQLNNGLKPEGEDVYFSEIGRYTGVYATDWSWGALIADFDNDGFKDLFVANGIYKDLNDQDYINYFSDPEVVRQALQKEGGGITSLIDEIPSQQISNYLFRNNGSLQFENKAGEWGLDAPSHSNGSAYGDLDNDGDLDLVVNNVNMSPFIYRNNDDNGAFLTVELEGSGFNSKAIGSQVTVYSGEQEFYQELNPMRGFQSSVDYRLHFGLGDIQMVDSIKVTWPDFKVSLLTNVEVNKSLTIPYEEASEEFKKTFIPTTRVFVQENNPDLSEIIHKENKFVDFDRDRLIFNMLSTQGPGVAVADVNKDGLDDVYFGGAKDQPGMVIIQTRAGDFELSQSFENEKGSEDVDALFFDADGDGDSDLYVASGGSEFTSSSPALADRLYINDGKGRFTKSNQILPAGKFESTATVSAGDYDADGDLDLFVGLRIFPRLYGVPTSGYILQNDGAGNFSNVSDSVAPHLKNSGMYTDGEWVDIDGDEDLDLVTIGEWMPITTHVNNQGKFESVVLDQTEGFWNTLKIADLDGDGDLDFIAGNHGLNSRFKASIEYPLNLYINDFDRNDTAEHIFTVYNQTGSYPLVLRQDLVMQMPELKKKYLSFQDYKEQEIHDIFDADQLENAIKLEAYMLSSVYGLNDGTGNFQVLELPKEVQFSPVYAIEVSDFNNDGSIDIIAGGNFYSSKPEAGIYDASYGSYLQGDGKGGFDFQSSSQSGFFVKGEVRKISHIKIGSKSHVLVARNNSSLKLFNVNE